MHRLPELPGHEYPPQRAPLRRCQAGLTAATCTGYPNYPDTNTAANVSGYPNYRVAGLPAATCTAVVDYPPQRAPLQQ